MARWVVVRFPNSFLNAEDRGLDGRLATEGELQGVLRKAMEALPVLMARGRLPEPDSVRLAKAEFVTSSDSLRSWLNEHCQLTQDGFTSRTVLYRAYGDHIASDGSRKLSSHEFYNRIAQVGGVTATVRNGVRGFRGIKFPRPAAPKKGAEGAEGAGPPTPGRAYAGERVGKLHLLHPDPGEAGGDVFAGHAPPHTQPGGYGQPHNGRDLDDPDDLDDPACLFDDPEVLVEDLADELCQDCGINRLLAPEAKAAGRCKPCRDAAHAATNGYEN